MAETQPLARTVTARIEAVGAGSDKVSQVGEAPFAGSITAVKYIADTELKGANTDSRTLIVENITKTLTVGETKFVSGTDAKAGTAKSITLSETAANVAVAEGDEIAVNSKHVGSTGLAQPTGLVEITFTRS